jgi:hypothetical protein
MAREAGLRIEFDPDMDGYEPTWFVLPDRGDTLTRFAKMAYEAGAAAEREALLKHAFPARVIQGQVQVVMVSNIRARGEKK